ncbi:hypothetical protein [Pedobacter sp. SYSU D00535]|uniref:hypothetical protein n=1 Tax=Pedobacter sp. SYSU D00535 TaxID=2810308 RepID=UPI001A965AD3|nr:hypothetical protein [Pedobacter sp. SYSU D00535]
MNREELVSELEKALTKAKVEKLATVAAKSPESVRSLISLSLYELETVAFRASWILEQIFFCYPESFFPNCSHFLNYYPQQRNSSCQRHYTKIMMTLTKDRAPVIFTHHQVDVIVEASFRWLIDEQTPVAVRVNCMDVLYNLRDCEDWIGEELRAQIVYQLKDGSAAMQSRGRKILERLKKKKQRTL